MTRIILLPPRGSENLAGRAKSPSLSRTSRFAFRPIRPYADAWVGGGGRRCMGWRKSSIRYASAAVLAALAVVLNRPGRTEENSADPAPNPSSQHDTLRGFV